MKVEVFGLRKYDFIDEKTKERRQGVTANYTYEDKSDNLVGLACGKFSATLGSNLYSAIMALPIPCKLRVYFNRNGKVDDFEILEV